MENGLIQQLASSIRKRITALPPLSSKCCIYRVPRTLRDMNEAAYEPCFVSIGPLLRGVKKLQSMQGQKLRYVQNFLRRNEKRSLKDYLRAIKEWEDETREYYIETIELSSHEFAEMVLLDGCFVIEFFLMWHFEGSDANDRIFGKPSLEHVIKRDLILLENQLPFFVLEGLYDLAFGSHQTFPSFSNLSCQVLIGQREFPEKLAGFEILHFVDLLRAYLLPSSLRWPDVVDNDDDSWEFPPGVGDLHDAGVKFEAGKNDPLLEIRFENGILRIPRLVLEDHTESFFLNLSAFEQCHYHLDSYIVDYLLLMDVLITTVKDVEILGENGILVNSMGNNEDVARLFNVVCKEFTYQKSRFYYSDLCRQLNSYSKAPWNKWKATLRHDYFRNPWTIISVIAAILLLILTVIQTVGGLLQLKR